MTHLPTRVVATIVCLGVVATVVGLASLGALKASDRSLPAARKAEEPHAQDQEGQRIRDQLGDKAAEFWIYDDLRAARKQSLRTKKPILVSLRCVP